MSDQPIDTNSADQIIVTVEQADALLEMIASDESAGRISSAALSSGLVSLGLVGANGLAGDAARILEPVRAAHSRIIIRVLSPSIPGIVRDWRIWAVAPRSVIMRSDVDGVHFSQVDDCEVPHIAALASLLHAGPTIHDGPPYIPADFVAAIRSLDAQGAQDVLNDLATYGPAESHFAQDCVSGRWSVVTCVREEKRRGQWRTGPHYECFVTDHLHAQIHAPLDEKALARLSANPTLDAPPRAAIWAMLMGLLAP
ncbi:XRE family transcriptional regulator [uncultured Actinomyces sp.]|uniref:XRE family transcriptional regulator n=1 Tax=uncultured Actinomyces sp. TaxID=249061 RepID=UPI0028EAC0A6|nr:XRE family transcriptional regulator [uncultured Actinomyces sp.]